MSMKSIGLLCLILFFVYFVLSYILSKTISLETMMSPITKQQQTVSGKENPYQHMEVSINTLNGEVEKLNKKLSGFDEKIAEIEKQIRDAMSMAKHAQNTANAANENATNLTKAMSGG